MLQDPYLAFADIVTCPVSLQLRWSAPRPESEIYVAQRQSPSTATVARFCLRKLDAFLHPVVNTSTFRRIVMDTPISLEQEMDEGSEVEASICCNDCGAQLDDSEYIYCPGRMEHKEGEANENSLLAGCSPNPLCDYVRCARCYQRAFELNSQQTDLCILEQCPHCLDYVLLFSDYVRRFSADECCIRDVYVTASDPFRLILLGIYAGKSCVLRCFYNVLRAVPGFLDLLRTFLFERLQCGFTYDRSLVHFLQDYERTSFETSMYGLVQCHFLDVNTNATLWGDCFFTVWGFWGPHSAILAILFKKFCCFKTEGLTAEKLFSTCSSAVLQNEDFRRLHFTEAFRVLTQKLFYIEYAEHLVQSTSLIWQKCLGFHENYVLWMVTVLDPKMCPVAILLPIPALEFKGVILFRLAEKVRAFWSNERRGVSLSPLCIEHTFWKRNVFRMGSLGWRQDDCFSDALRSFDMERVWSLLIYGPETWTLLDIHCPQVKTLAVIDNSPQRSLKRFRA